MPSEMLRRVAKVIWEEHIASRASSGEQLPSVSYEDGADKPLAEFIARQAIEAMWNPTDPIISAVADFASDQGEDVYLVAAQAWSAGIDAALADGGERGE